MARIIFTLIYFIIIGGFAVGLIRNAKACTPEEAITLASQIHEACIAAVGPQETLDPTPEYLECIALILSPSSPISKTDM